MVFGCDHAQLELVKRLMGVKARLHCLDGRSSRAVEGYTTPTQNLLVWCVTEYEVETGPVRGDNFIVGQVLTVQQPQQTGRRPRDSRASGADDRAVELV